MKTADKAIKSIGLSLIVLLSFSHIYVIACLLIEVQTQPETYNSLEVKSLNNRIQRLGETVIR